MRILSGVALFTLGAATAIVYEKYGQPVVCKMEKNLDEAMKKASKKLENMM